MSGQELMTNRNFHGKIPVELFVLPFTAPATMSPARVSGIQILGTAAHSIEIADIGTPEGMLYDQQGRSTIASLSFNPASSCFECSVPDPGAVGDCKFPLRR